MGSVLPGLWQALWQAFWQALSLGSQYGLRMLLVGKNTRLRSLENRPVHLARIENLRGNIAPNCFSPEQLSEHRIEHRIEHGVLRSLRILKLKTAHRSTGLPLRVSLLGIVSIEP